MMDKNEKIEQDLSMLNLPEERDFEIKEGEVKKVKVYPLSVQDSILFFKIYNKLEKSFDVDVDVATVEAIESGGDEFITLISKSLRAKKDDIKNAPITFLVWAIEQILEVSRLDFFMERINGVKKMVETMTKSTDSEKSSEESQEKKAGD